MGGSAAVALAPSPPASSQVWDFSVPDWRERLRKGQSLLPALPLDEKRAARALRVFEGLRLPDVPGTPTLAEAAGDWQRDIIRALFGGFDETGARRVKEVLVLVPKKNSKTTGLAAPAALTALLLNERPMAEFIVVGPTQKIADTLFEAVVGMILADEEGFLAQRFHVQDHKKTIIDRTTKAKLRVKTFDMKVMTGTKPAGVFIDELHVMSTMHAASSVIGQMRGGFIAYPESFLLMITTQSDHQPAGAFKAELDYARRVRDGKIPNARKLAVLYEFPEEVQTSKDRAWMNPALWPQVTPNLGRSVALSELVAGFEEAREKGEEELRRWSSQHLNIEIGLALAAQRWRGADYWEAAGDPALTLDALIARCEVAVMGVDAGGLDDLFAAVVAGRCAKTRAWLYWAHAWADPSVLELRKDIAPALKDFESAGDLTFAETTKETIDAVVALAARLRAARLFPKEAGIGLDPAGIGALLDALSEAGFAEPLVAGVPPQGFKLSSAVWSMERMLKDGSVVHAGQPLMAFAVANAVAETRGNAVHVTKQVAGRAKIDPLIAAFLATKLLEANPSRNAATPRLYFV